MNNCLFEVSEEDSISLVFQRLAELLNDSQEGGADSAGAQFLAAFQQHVERDDETEEIIVPDEAISSLLALFIEQVPLLFDKSSDADAESCVELVNHRLLIKLPAEECSQFSASLAAAISATPEQKTETRLACLMHLYNACVYPEVQYSILMRTIEFAISSGLASVLAPVIKGHADAFVSNWKLTPAAASSLYLAIAALVRQSKGDKETHLQSIALTSKALASVDATDSSACKEVAGEAAEAISDFLKARKIFTCDLLELAPVKALAKNPIHLYLHQLFSAVTRGQLDQLDAVCRSDLLVSLGITKEQCREKTRMNALLNLARASGNQPIPYDNIASALQIQRADVENWIVKASGEKLLGARIDQIHEVVSVINCVSRGFDGSDWVKLKGQLKSWREMLTDMQRTMKETSVSEGLISSLVV